MPLLNKPYQCVDIKLSEGLTHCHIYDKNKGDWVVLIHGLITPQFAWGFLFEALVKAGYNVISFDLYGRGKSDIPNINYTFAVYLKQIAEIIEHVSKDKPVDLIGWSMGGALASLYAMQQPERVNKIVLISPGVVVSTGRFIKRLVKYPLASRLFVKMGQRLLRNRMQQHFHSTTGISDYTRKATSQITQPGFWTSLLSIIVNYPDDLLNQLADYANTGPAPLVIWGEKDANTPYADCTDVTRVLNGRLFTVKNAAHAVHYEYPDCVNEEIIQHLNS